MQRAHYFHDFVYTHAYIYIYTKYINIYTIYKHTHTHSHTYTHTHTHIYIYIYIYICKYIHVAKKTDNVPFRLLPIRQWLHSNSQTWARDVHFFYICKYVYVYVNIYSYAFIIYINICKYSDIYTQTRCHVVSLFYMHSKVYLQTSLFHK